MATEAPAYGRGTRGSHSVLIHGNRLRNRAGLTPRGFLVVSTSGHASEMDAITPPIQSFGGSPTSSSIDDYLISALSDYSGLISEQPKQIRVTASPETRAAAMDPWDAKNGRRIRLIEKKHREGLNEKEAAELARLKREVAAHMEVVAPRSTEVIDEIAGRIESLKKKAAAKRGKKT